MLPMERKPSLRPVSRAEERIADMKEEVWNALEAVESDAWFFHDTVRELRLELVEQPG